MFCVVGAFRLLAPDSAPLNPADCMYFGSINYYSSDNPESRWTGQLAFLKQHNERRHSSFAMSSLQSRKDEILAKKAKLAELKRQRELRQKEFTNNRQSIDATDVWQDCIDRYLRS